MSSSVRNFLARRDTPEGRPSSREQAQKVQLTLQSLNPSFARLRQQQNHSLSHRSSVPSLLSSSLSMNVETLCETKAPRSPSPILTLHHSAQQSPTTEDFESPTSLSATVIPSPSYLPMPAALRLELPFSTLMPSPPPPALRKRRRFSMLSPKFGEALPPLEVAFSADTIDDVEPRKACDDLDFRSVGSATNVCEGAAGGAHRHRPSEPIMHTAERRTVLENCTTWALERNGRRSNIAQHDYHQVVDFLRRL